jgi:ring-1,2-phenylacetyl-CoA epoxidase subunit PaaE
MSTKKFYSLVVTAIQTLAEQSKSISFSVPKELNEIFKYQSGQYLTLKINFNEQEERRAYSICSSPFLDKNLTIGIKKITNGKVSSYLYDSLKIGDSIEMMPPQGNFCIYTAVEDKKDYFFIAAGSGVTPVFSMLKTIIETEPKSKVHLLYGNRAENSIMFKDELEQLSKRYEGQLFVEHVLSQPKTEKKGGIFGFFAKTSSSWQGQIGRINQEKIAKFIQKYRSEDQRNAFYYLCGPEKLMQITTQALVGMGVAEADIFKEYFYTAPSSEGNNITQFAENQTVIATINGQKTTIELLPKETILQGFIRSKSSPPFSCMAGACSTCMAKLISGEVKMERCLALSDSEVKNGFILTCTSRPISDLVEINYDV